MNFRNTLLLRPYCELVAPLYPEETGIGESAAAAGKIVLAESDPSELEHIASILRNLGFTVITAQDGKAALDLVEKHSPQMVLSSLELARIDGNKLCRAMRENRDTQGIPFMLILPPGEFHDRLVRHEIGAHDYIQKPVVVSEFSRRVKSLLNMTAGPTAAVENLEDGDRSDSDPGRSREKRSAESKGVEAVFPRSQEQMSASQLVEQMDNLLRELGQCLEKFRTWADLDRGVVRSAGFPDSTPVASESSIGKESEMDALFEVIRSPVMEEEKSRNEQTSAGLSQEPSGEHMTGSSGEKEDRRLTQDTSPRPVEGKTGTNYSKIGGYLTEFKERMAEGTLPRAEEDTSAGADELFSEFFEKESTTREDKVAVRSTESPRQTPQDSRNRNGLFEQAEAHVRESLRRVGTGKEPDIECGAGLSERMVSSISRGNSLVLVATDRKQGFSISTHCVNVAVFSIRIAQTLNCDLQTQREVALAALYHELGVVELSKDLVYRTKNPTREEMNLLRERPLYSARILRNLGHEYYWLSRIVSQVFERENGMGHPRRLNGEELCEQAKIIGIADVFDACIHKRPYREALSGYQSLFELTTDQQRSFSDRMVKALIRSFSLYPYNECVRISTGELGQVVDINSKNLSRPIVKVLFDRHGKALPQPRMVDLSKEAQLYISEALKGSKCL